MLLDTASQQVVAEDDPPPPVGPERRLTASSDSNARAPGDLIPASVQPTDQLVVFVTTNRAATLTPPTGWTSAPPPTGPGEVLGAEEDRGSRPGRHHLHGPTRRRLQVQRGPPGLQRRRHTLGADQPRRGHHCHPHGRCAVRGGGEQRVHRVGYYVDKGANAHTWALSPRSSSERPRWAAAAGSSRWPTRTRAASPPGPRRRSAPPLASRPRKPSPGPSSLPPA